MRHNSLCHTNSTIFFFYYSISFFAVIHRTTFKRFKTFYSNSTNKIKNDEINNCNMKKMLKKLKFLDAEDAQIEAQITDHFNENGASHEHNVLSSKSNERIFEKKIFIETKKHVNLNWTACYDLDCQIHLSDKKGSRWFSKKPKKAIWRTQQSGEIFIRK